MSDPKPPPFTTRPMPALYTGIVDIHWADRGYDLDRVIEGGVSAMMHKATEGCTWKDKAFALAMDRLRDMKMLRGAYHFASGLSDARDQADAFVDEIGEMVMAPDDVLLALDLEGSLDHPATMTTAAAVRFVERLHAKTNRWPVLYAGSSKLRERARLAPSAMAVLGRCPLWLAQYGEMPRRERIPAAWPNGWDLWQYTNGSDGPHDRELYPRRTLGFEREAQDRSAFRGSADELATWWRTCGRST